MSETILTKLSSRKLWAGASGVMLGTLVIVFGVTLFNGDATIIGYGKDIVTASIVTYCAAEGIPDAVSIIAQAIAAPKTTNTNTSTTSMAVNSATTSSQTKQVIDAVVGATASAVTKATEEAKEQ